VKIISFWASLFVLHHPFSWILKLKRYFSPTSFAHSITNLYADIYHSLHWFIFMNRHWKQFPLMENHSKTVVLHHLWFMKRLSIWMLTDLNDMLTSHSWHRLECCLCQIMRVVGFKKRMLDLKKDYLLCFFWLNNAKVIFMVFLIHGYL